MEITKNEFKESLVEVRKAYRLLYAYQKRIIDLVNFIGNHWNFTFNSGHPWFTGGLPRRSSVTLKNQSWDWLPMYYYDFYFEKPNSDLQFGVIIQADTGFFDSGLTFKIQHLLLQLTIFRLFVNNPYIGQHIKSQTLFHIALFFDKDMEGVRQEVA